MKQGHVRNLNDIINALRAGKRITKDEAGYVSAVIAFASADADQFRKQKAAQSRGGKRRSRPAWQDIVRSSSERIWRSDPKRTASRIAQELADGGMLDTWQWKISIQSARKFISLLRRK